MLWERNRRNGRGIINPSAVTLAVCCILLCQGCVLISSLSGSKELKPVNTSELIRYMIKAKIDTSEAYYLTKPSFIDLVNENINPTSIQIFDKTGQLYTVYTGTIACQGINQQFFSEKFDAKNLIPVDNSPISSILESGLINLCDKPEKSFLSLLEKKDFTVVIYWATFGLHNKRIPDWQKAIASDSSLQMITVDFDPNTNWDES